VNPLSRLILVNLWEHMTISDGVNKCICNRCTKIRKSLYRYVAFLSHGLDHVSTRGMVSDKCSIYSTWLHELQTQFFLHACAKHLDGFHLIRAMWTHLFQGTLWQTLIFTTVCSKGLAHCRAEGSFWICFTSCEKVHWLSTEKYITDNSLTETHLLCGEVWLQR